MTERREMKQRSPAVWARVKAAYLAGEPAASVARRFDVGLGNLRFRANAEGWTRKAAMAAADFEQADEDIRLAGMADRSDRNAAAQPSPAAALPDIDPRTAMNTAVRRASGLIAEGRAVEAVALLKATEALARLTGHPCPGEDDEDDEAHAWNRAKPMVLTPEEDAVHEAHLRSEWERIMDLIREEAATLAHHMLADTVSTKFVHGGFVYRWRAEMLGPDVEAADRRHAEAGNWHLHYWDENGRLRSRDDTDDRAWRAFRSGVRMQHGMTARAPEG